MTQNFSQNTVQSALGYYFKTPSLISAAFTHVSFSDTENNETLIFLGEKLFDFIISDYVSSHYPFSTEKQLRERYEGFKRAIDHKSFISDKKLSQSILLSPKNEDMRESKALHGEIFLAICAAIYRDGGIASFKSFILPLIRAVDSESRYAPKTESYSASYTDVRAERTEDKKDTAVSSPKAADKKAEKQRAAKLTIDTESVKPAKESAKKSAKVSSTEKTAEKTEEQKEKKGVGLLKAIMLPTKGRKKDADAVQTPKNTDVSAEKPTEEGRAEAKEQKRSFIRDALAPVSLPESMRNPKPRKPLRAVGETTTAENGTATATGEASYSEDTENYKSLLQEYVQKNIRTASVLIKYNTERRGGVFVTELTLDGKTLASAEGAIKKSAEKEAARLAYGEITSAKSPLYSWFNTLSAETPEKAPDNYVSRLNEYYQKKSRSSAAPLTYEPRPSGEKKTFAVAIIFNGEELSVGKGHTVKDAKQNAARAACEKLNIR